MLSKTRYGASLARKPMVYSRTENGSARAEKSIEEVENVGNKEKNIDESNEQTEENNNEKNEATSEAPPVEKSKHKPHPPSHKTPRRKGLDNTDIESRPKVYLRPAKRGHPQLSNRKSLFTEDPLLTSNGPLLAQFHHPVYEEEIERAIAERNDALTRGLLSRRRMNRLEMLYFPDAAKMGNGSIRTSRSDPAWIARSRRLMHDRALTNRSSYANGYRKESLNDKAVAFYRSFDSVYPELRLIINETRFVDLYDLMEDLTRILNLADNERYIHTAYGTIVQDLADFEDGGVYFFGPPFIYEFDDYNQFQEKSTPDLIESENGNSDSKNEKEENENESDDKEKEEDDASEEETNTNNKYKEIKVKASGILPPIKFIVDIKRHKSLFQVLHDLSELFSPARYGRVEGLCTQKGRTVLSVNELLSSDPDEEFVAICSPLYNDYHLQSRYLHDAYHNPVTRRNYPYRDLFYDAKVVVIYDGETKQQRFYAEHTDEIRCVSQHPNSWIFATGQVSGGSSETLDHVRIWDSKALVTMNILNFDELDLSIECLTFSQADNGVKLAAIATTGDDWILTVWKWQDSDILSKSQVYKAIDLSCTFDPADNNRLVSCGKKHIYFWDISDEVAVFEEGEFEGYDVPDFITCLSFNSKQELVTGDSNAYIHFWTKDARKTSTVIKTKHTGSIIILQILSGEHILTGGGSDRLLTLIDCNESVPTVAEAQMSEEYGGIVAIAPCKPGFIGTDFASMKLYLGTSMNTLLYGTMNTEFECFVSATSDQLFCLAVNPKDDTLLVTGFDSFTSLKSTDDHSDIWRLKFEYPCTAATFYPTGDVVAIGTASGNWVVLDATDSNQIASFQSDRTKVTCLSYSPDGAILAVGSDSGSISLYNVFDDGISHKYRSSLKSYRDAIVSIDWTLNRSHFRFVTVNYDLDYVNVEYHREEFRHHIIRDLKFERQTCALHYSTAGIWKSAEKGVLFKAVANSHGKKLFCAGSNTGQIRLFVYPAHPKMPMFHEITVHSTSISSVLFTSDDQKLITCGENDYCIAQWSVGCNSDTKKNGNNALKRAQSTASQSQRGNNEDE